MENKHYTPEIEEFHNGFEYYAPVYGSKELVKCVFDITKSPDCSWNKDADGNISYPENFFKVKYLDREDIESLGWVQRDLDTFDFSSGNFALEFNDEYQTFIYRTGPRNNTLFQGKIKNKSELKKIMMQIGI